MKYTLKGKEIKFALSERFRDAVSGLETHMYISLALKCLRTKPVDMLVFETESQIMSIRSAGYDLFNPETNPDEKTIILSFASLPTETFWMKIDDYKTYFLGTFLFPEEY